MKISVLKQQIIHELDAEDPASERYSELTKQLNLISTIQREDARALWIAEHGDAIVKACAMVAGILAIIYAEKVAEFLLNSKAWNLLK